MTKYTSNIALVYIIEINKVDIQAAAWVERKGGGDERRQEGETEEDIRERQKKIN